MSSPDLWVENDGDLRLLVVNHHWFTIIQGPREFELRECFDSDFGEICDPPTMFTSLEQAKTEGVKAYRKLLQRLMEQARRRRDWASADEMRIGIEILDRGFWG